MNRFLLVATLCASGSLVTGCTEKAPPPPP
ncbi:MAG: hypothetical protein H6Q89_5055, partial [Myxococcaceae bacterium]|nr:hypothetical protein [Myxococcaceae bacterium]